MSTMSDIYELNDQLREEVKVAHRSLASLRLELEEARERLTAMRSQLQQVDTLRTEAESECDRLRRAALAKEDGT